MRTVRRNDPGLSSRKEFGIGIRARYVRIVTESRSSFSTLVGERGPALSSSRTVGYTTAHQVSVYADPSYAIRLRLGFGRCGGLATSQFLLL
jgi:hypothetical protein